MKIDNQSAIEDILEMQSKIISDLIKENKEKENLIKTLMKEGVR